MLQRVTTVGSRVHVQTAGNGQRGGRRPDPARGTRGAPSGGALLSSGPPPAERANSVSESPSAATCPSGRALNQRVPCLLVHSHPWAWRRHLVGSELPKTKPSLPHAQETLLPDDQMIQHVDAQQVTRFHQLAGDVDILR